MTLMKEKMQELEQYKPTGTCPKDFKTFWIDKIKSDGIDTAQLELEAISYPLSKVQVFKAALRAGDGVSLKGYYLCPALNRREGLNSSESENDSLKFPGLVRFHGYSGNRGQISELLFWALQGYAILGLDVRGQCGETPDSRVYPMGAFSGWMTLGLDTPQNHYFRQVYLDAARAVEALGRQPEVDAKRIGVFGKSQGGGLAVIAAGLVNGFGAEVGMRTQVKAVSAAIPFLADFRGGFKFHSEGPLAELSWYFRLFDPEHRREEEVFKVLDYFDALYFAPLIGKESQCLVSVGLQDKACPPPTVYSLYQALKGEKELLVYPEYGHESPDEFVDHQINFFASKLNLN